MSFYGRSLRWVFSVVVPILFLTTVPSELLFGRRAWWWALMAVAVAGAAVLVAALIWNREVRRYSGAMS